MLLRCHEGTLTKAGALHAVQACLNLQDFPAATVLALSFETLHPDLLSIDVLSSSILHCLGSDTLVCMALASVLRRLRVTRVRMSLAQAEECMEECLTKVFSLRPEFTGFCIVLEGRQQRAMAVTYLFPQKHASARVGEAESNVVTEFVQNCMKTEKERLKSMKPRRGAYGKRKKPNPDSNTVVAPAEGKPSVEGGSSGGAKAGDGDDTASGEPEAILKLSSEDSRGSGAGEMVSEGEETEEESVTLAPGTEIGEGGCPEPAAMARAGNLEETAPEADVACAPATRSSAVGVTPSHAAPAPGVSGFSGQVAPADLVAAGFLASAAVANSDCALDGAGEGSNLLGAGAGGVRQGELSSADAQISAKLNAGGTGSDVTLALHPPTAAVPLFRPFLEMRRASVNRDGPSTQVALSKTPAVRAEGENSGAVVKGLDGWKLRPERQNVMLFIREIGRTVNVVPRTHRRFRNFTRGAEMRNNVLTLANKSLADCDHLTKGLLESGSLSKLELRRCWEEGALIWLDADVSLKDVMRKAAEFARTGYIWSDRIFNTLSFDRMLLQAFLPQWYFHSLMLHLCTEQGRDLLAQSNIRPDLDCNIKNCEQVPHGYVLRHRAILGQAFMGVSQVALGFGASKNDSVVPGVFVFLESKGVWLQIVERIANSNPRGKAALRRPERGCAGVAEKAEVFGWRGQTSEGYELHFHPTVTKAIVQATSTIHAFNLDHFERHEFGDNVLAMGAEGDGLRSLVSNEDGEHFHERMDLIPAKLMKALSLGPNTQDQEGHMDVVGPKMEMIIADAANDVTQKDDDHLSPSVDMDNFVVGPLPAAACEVRSGITKDYGFCSLNILDTVSYKPGLDEVTGELIGYEEKTLSIPPQSVLVIAGNKPHGGMAGAGEDAYFAEMESRRGLTSDDCTESVYPDFPYWHLLTRSIKPRIHLLSHRRRGMELASNREEPAGTVLNYAYDRGPRKENDIGVFVKPWK